MMSSLVNLSPVCVYKMYLFERSYMRQIVIIACVARNHQWGKMILVWNEVDDGM